MRVLVDTNILGRLAQPRHSLHSLVVEVLDTLDDAGHELRLVPQVPYEFSAIATRSISENGLGFSIDEAKALSQRFKLLFPPLRDERGIFEPWEKLVFDYSVKGKPTHDARLVAAMQRHRLTHILSFNGSDFRRYSAITVLDPQAIVKP